jgi:hypothetical protein
MLSGSSKVAAVGYRPQVTLTTGIGLAAQWYDTHTDLVPSTRGSFTPQQRRAIAVAVTHPNLPFDLQ